MTAVVKSYQKTALFQEKITRKLTAATMAKVGQ